MSVLVFLVFNSGTGLWWTDVQKVIHGYSKLKCKLKLTYLNGKTVWKAFEFTSSIDV